MDVNPPIQGETRSGDLYFVERRKYHPWLGTLGQLVHGRMLFELAAAAQARDLDPEGALRQHADGLVRHVEGRLQKTTA